MKTPVLLAESSESDMLIAFGTSGTETHKTRGALGLESMIPNCLFPLAAILGRRDTP